MTARIARKSCTKYLTSKTLFGCKLPNEQALGILWNVEPDTLGFKIAIKEKPLIRRGILSPLSSIYNPLGLGDLFCLKENR